MSLNKVTIKVPSSTANVGPGYDTWCLGVENPQLHATLEKVDEPGIEVVVQSNVVPPQGRILGQAGRVALEAFFTKHGIPLDKTGFRLTYTDSGYPVGGLGRSGAEAVGAVTAAAVLCEKGGHMNGPTTRNERINDSAQGEPGNHMDNVAGSMNGGFSIVVPRQYYEKSATVDSYKVPDDLGLVIGYSSFQKTGGTEAGRKVLQDSVHASTFNHQVAVASAATAALVSGNTSRFLELVTRDLFHQPRRANVGFYGAFNADDFLELQRDLYDRFGVAWNVSGAGPNMSLLYSTLDHRNPGQLVEEVSVVTTPWFEDKGITMNLVHSRIAKSGAYGYAVREHGYDS